MNLNDLRTDQIQAVNKTVNNDGRLAILAAKRAGKTATALGAAKKLGAKKVLVIGKTNFLSQTWTDEVKKWDFELPYVQLTDGSVYDRAMKLKAIAKAEQPALVGLTYDAWWRSDLRSVIREYWQPDLVVYDEAQHLLERGNHSARFAHQISTREKWFKHSLAMTATWIESGYEELFGLFKACDPTVFGTRFDEFAVRYLVIATHVCRACKGLVVSGQFTIDKTQPCAGTHHVGPYVEVDGQQIVGYYNLDEMFAKARLHSHYIEQKDLNIPAPKDVLIDINLSPEMRKQYDAFVHDTNYEFVGESGLTMDIVGGMPLTVRVKAKELACGWVQNADGDALDISHEKLDAATEIAISENKAGRQHAIYTQFNHNVRRLAKALNIPLKQTYSGLAGSGTTGDKNRANTLQELKAGNLGIIIGNSSMIAEGLNLSMCGSATHFDHVDSSVKHDQLTGRLQGEGLFPTEFHLFAKHTVERPIYDELLVKMARRGQVFSKLADFQFLW